MATAAQLGVRFAAAFLVLFGLPVLGWALLRAAGLPGADAAPAAYTECGMALFAVAAAVIAGIAWRWPPAAPLRPLRPAAVVAVYVPGVLVWLVALLGYLALLRWCGRPLEPQDALAFVAAADFARPGYWVTLLAIVLGAPVAEEIVFRGYLQGALQQRLPRWAAIALASAAFGLVHGAPYAVPVGLLGVLFGWIFARQGSLLAPIAAHALHNGLTVAVAILWPGHLELLYPR